MKLAVAVLPLAFAIAAQATEFHATTTGSDANPGTKKAPFRTVQRAADMAQPGDTITVHAGVYRERIDPPRGGTSDTKRIVYQAAPGEKVVITGSEPIKGWERVTNDTWKVTLPNKFFGKFNPYAERVYGDWFNSRGRVHHRGCVYLNDVSMTEAASHLNEVLAPAGKRLFWYAKADNAEDGDYLLNLASFTVGQQRISASTFVGKKGELHVSNDQCVGWIRDGSWLRFDKVDFGDGKASIEFQAASVTGGGDIEIRLDKADGELLGRCAVADTGGWHQWQVFSAKIKPISGEKNICFLFRLRKVESNGTTIWAQFPGVNPNEANVEINVRPTVFTPEKTNIDFITVRGFELRNAATTWAAPTSGQQGLVTAYWCKGWIIENNEIHHSRCCGIALGKYSDEYDNKRGNKEGYDGTIADALKSGGWTKEKIGSHVVRNNHIHHCGQTGIVGSLGCAFSRIEKNEIHDISLNTGWDGAEMAGIKFHAAIDVVIKGNHIYNCGEFGGLWLDWMAQGTQIIGNLFHDNEGRDLFTEVDHGPFLIANNIMLSPNGYLANSQGGAYAHNLILGNLSIHYDSRQTPYHKAHSTELAGRHDCPIGDMRWYNNLLAGRCNLSACDGAVMPVAAAGNVFAKGAQPSKFDEEALIKTDFDPGIKLTQRADGWYLEITVDPAWATERPRKLVTSGLLGKAVIPDLPFENPDASPLKVDVDYFGKKRSGKNPFPGPFEYPLAGKTVKVWPPKD
jgi:hypothetical protein